MLHVFSINRVKLVARTPMVTIKKGQREIYKIIIFLLSINIGREQDNISPRWVNCEQSGRKWLLKVYITSSRWTTSLLDYKIGFCTSKLLKTDHHHHITKVQIFLRGSFYNNPSILTLSHISLQSSKILFSLINNRLIYTSFYMNRRFYGYPRFYAIPRPLNPWLDSL
jgi:hypothetical protein